MFRYFFVYLKTPKTTYLSSGRIFVTGEFHVFGWFFWLFGGHELVLQGF